MVNTELYYPSSDNPIYYNILNIVVNTEHKGSILKNKANYNILNIVVNTELYKLFYNK